MIPASEFLRPELERLDQLIGTEVRRMRARYELSQDELGGLLVTDAQVDALLVSTRGAIDRKSRPDIAAARAADQDSRWAYVALTLELDDDERDLLLICAAPELFATYEPIYAYLNDNADRRWPTIELAVRLLARDEAHALLLRGMLLPAGKLLATGMLETVEQKGLPRSQRPLRLAPPVADWLRGLAYSDERLVGLARYGALEPRMPDAALPAALAAVLPGVTQRLRARDTIPVALMVGASAAEAQLYAEELFARAERLTITLSLAALARHATPAEALKAATLQAKLLGLGVILLCDEPPSLQPDNPVPSNAAALRGFIRSLHAVAIAADPAADAAPMLGNLPLLRIELPQLQPGQRTALWEALLAENPRCAETPDLALLASVADRFALSPERVLQAASSAVELAELEGKSSPDRGHLYAAARAASQGGTGPGTSLVRTSYGWDDLILSAELEDRLEDIIAAIERRALVLDQWGMARHTGGERGIAIMFAGPSGTGKTMAAAVMADRLQLDLHKINIGAIMSKYIGETEKNLDAAFEAARAANALLFIDEADALLGKRSEARSAQDRYANVEVAYLLQKMETYDGIVIMATNLPRNIDDAFARRVQYVVTFPIPDMATRERMWRGMLTDEIPHDQQIDIAFLARQFELTGGEIRNVMLDAAYRAARSSVPIDFGDLLQAVARLYAKRGTVLTAVDLREHYPLLADGRRRSAGYEPMGSA